MIWLMFYRITLTAILRIDEKQWGEKLRDELEAIAVTQVKDHGGLCRVVAVKMVRSS